MKRISEINFHLSGIILHSCEFNELGISDEEEYESLRARLVGLCLPQEIRIG